MKNDLRWRLGTSDHPKIIRLIAATEERAFRALARLWEWTAAHRPDGNLRGMDHLDVCIAAGWPEGGAKFVEALRSVRLLDGPEGKFAIHDWEDEQSWVVGGPKRSAVARNAAKARWDARFRAMLPDAPSNALSTKQQCPSPTPTPTPNPTPTPTPKIPEKNPDLSPAGDLFGGEPSIPDPKPKTARPLPPLVLLWNRIAAEALLPQVSVVNDHRARLVKGAIHDEPDLAVWERAFRAIAASPHHRGRNDRGWKADFDFATRSSTRGKWLDEARNSGHTHAGAPPLTPEEEAADLERRRAYTAEVKARLGISSRNGIGA